MYLTVSQKLNGLSKCDYKALRLLSHTAKNLVNEAIYNIRQYYFTEGEYLRYESNYHLLKNSPNYRLLNSNMAQQILQEVDGSFKAFFGLLKLAKQGRYSYRDCRLPHYLPKDGFATLVIGFIRIKDNRLTIPFSNPFRKTHPAIKINLPCILRDKKIKEIRIIPKVNARFFEVQYIYEAETSQRVLDSNKALALDLGINNLVTAVSTEGDSFIIDGREIKSLNQWFNKENSRLQCIKDKQNLGHKPTKRQGILAYKRHNQLRDYLGKTAKKIIDYCLSHNIGKLVVGYNETFQNSPRLGRVTNQNFVNIPFGNLRSRLEYLCRLNGIIFVKQEESYTSKASFWDSDSLPVYNADNPQSYSFSGRRIFRGLYKTKEGKVLNADVNGALNILRKSNVVSLDALYARGDVNTPIRIRVFKTKLLKRNPEKAIS